MTRQGKHRLQSAALKGTHSKERTPCNCFAQSFDQIKSEVENMDKKEDEGKDNESCGDEILEETKNKGGRRGQGRNKRFQDNADQEAVLSATKADGKGSVGSQEDCPTQFPLAENGVINEIREAERRAKATAACIASMREQIQCLTKKDDLTTEEVGELQEKQSKIVEKLAEFEAMTKRIQQLVGLADCPTTPSPLTLPRVVVAPTSSSVPKVIIVDDHGPGETETKCRVAVPKPKTDDAPDPEALLEHLSGRLDASYRLQEKLAQENAEMEGHRYQLEEALLSKEKTMENLQRQMEGLRCEMKALNAENVQLKDKLQCCKDTKEKDNAETGMCKKSMCGTEPLCKMELYKQMGLPLPPGTGHTQVTVPGPADAPRCMETLVDSMEEEVRAMQRELTLVQAERRSLDIQRKLLKCASPGPGAQHLNFPCPKPPVCAKEKRECEAREELISKVEAACAQPGPPPEPPRPACVKELETQLRELRTQYNRLQQDFKNKVEEVSACRAETERAKREAGQAAERVEEADARADDLLARLKIVENEKSRMVGSRDQAQDMEQQAILARQRCAEALEEVEEMKALVDDQTKQLEDYRNKYITAQEMVEEQRRQMDQMEVNNARYSGQLNMELQQVKAEFQKRLEELSPLPELLKQTQQRLTESQQLRAIAERSCQQLTSELEELKDRIDAMESKEEVGQVTTKHEDDSKQELLRLKAVVSRLEEMGAEKERELECRRREATQLAVQLETLREESARQVARTKERSEALRRGLHGHIADLEVQLAQARAQARAAAKDRDEIRMKMEAQVAALTKNFEQAQGWVRCLQSHINFLKPAEGVILPSKDNPQCRRGPPHSESPYIPVENV